MATLLQLGVALGAAAMLAAQSTGGRPLDGLLLDPSRRPVASAQVQFVADPVPELPALDGLLPPPPPVTAHSNDHGRFRFERLSGPGTVLVTTADFSGAFAERGRPGTPLTLLLEPLAAVTAPGPLQLWAARRDADGNRRFLPPLAGDTVYLPAGQYEVWYRIGEAFGWQPLQLRSGKALELPQPPVRRRLVRHGCTTTFPSGWPQIDLFAAAPHCELLGDAGLSTLTTRVEGTGALLVERLPEVGPAPRPWPLLVPATPTVALHVDGATAGAAVWLLQEQPRDGAWLPRAMATVGADGDAQLPRPDGDDLWLLVTAPGRAPLGLRWQTPAPASVALAAAAPLQVTCTASADVAGVCLEYEPLAAPIARQRCHTDELGRASFARGAGPGRLLVSDPRFLNASVAVAAGDDGVELRLEPGVRLAGRAVFAGDRPAAGVAVTLRDPQGRLRPAERTVLTDADGGFHFAGLPAGDQFVLFARARPDGRTWSGKLLPARADGSRYVVELRCEDPEPPRGDGRTGRAR